MIWLMQPMRDEVNRQMYKVAAPAIVVVTSSAVLLASAARAYSDLPYCYLL
jgi:hypothetical protein